LIFGCGSNTSATGGERMRIDSSGRLLINHNSSINNAGVASQQQITGDSAATASLSIRRDANSSSGPLLIFGKSRSGALGNNVSVASGDNIGSIVFAAADGTDVSSQCAEIKAQIDGTPGSNDTPGRLIFMTASDGSNAPTERMRISSEGKIGIGHGTPQFALTIAQSANDSGALGWEDGGNSKRASIRCDTSGDALTFSMGSSDTERMRLTPAGELVVGKTAAGVASRGGELRDGNADYAVTATANSHIPLIVNRNSDDGGLIRFRQANTDEGTISVSGGTVTYGSFCGTHWGRLGDSSKPEILPGTILETINKVVEWKVIEFTVDGVQKRQAYNGSAENGDSVTVEYEGVSYTGTVADEVPDSDVLNKHVCVKVSDTAASKAVFGVFLGWDTDDEEGIIGTWNDMNIAALGNYFIRIKSGQTLEIGDLIESDGTGCGVVQSDDIIRSKTVAKVTSTTSHQVYADGSFLVTCVLYSG